ncbi:conjugal transfer protein TraF [Thiothrix sp.]|jgi:conjugal transfer pilus assembly protein TraF|uniref:conjugal transfer protein TraF n=1 Tax=Thiothrix sp. TaxID=1032 RepID=UPI002580D6C2|nr:conjugal transfer protein TraF [Thiothrix sp.]
MVKHVVSHLLVLLLSLLFTQSAVAAAQWYGDKERGWFWREEPPKPVVPEPKPEPKAIPSPTVPAPEPAKPATATAAMEAVRAELEEAKNAAILTPTPDKVAHYLKLQEQTMNQAMLFTDMWQRVRWANPTLDYAFIHPTAAGGVRVDRQLTRDEQKAAVKAVAKDNGLFFFFKPNCPFCDEQGRILQALASEYDMTIMPIALNGATNPYFPNAKPDNGIAATMGVQDAPALFIVNPDTKESLPLGYGVIPLDEIETRIRRLLTMQPGVY